MIHLHAEKEKTGRRIIASHMVDMDKIGKDPQYKNLKRIGTEALLLKPCT